MIRPQPALRLGDGPVLDQDDAADEAPGDIEIEFANPLCAERIGGERVDGYVNRLIRLQRSVKRARTFRLDADDLDAALKPGGHTGDKPAAADRNEDRVELLKAQSFEILLPLERHRTLSGDRLHCVVRMNQERAALGDIRVASLLSLGIRRAANHRFRAVSLDLRDLGGRSDFRHEDARADPELLGGESDGGAVIAARGGGATGRGCESREEIMEGPPRFERTCRLQAFELERERRRAGSRRRRLEERRAADVAANTRMGRADVGRRDGAVIVKCEPSTPLGSSWAAPQES